MLLVDIVKINKKMLGVRYTNYDKSEGFAIIPKSSKKKIK